MAIKKISQLDNVYGNKTDTVPIANLRPENLNGSGLSSNLDKNDPSNMLRSIFEISYNKEPNATAQNTGTQGIFESRHITYAQLYRDITNNIYYKDSYLSGNKELSGHLTLKYGNLTLLDGSLNINTPSAENSSTIKDTSITLSSSTNTVLQNNNYSKLILNNNITCHSKENIELSAINNIKLDSKNIELSSKKSKIGLNENNTDISSENINLDSLNINIKTNNITFEPKTSNSNKLNIALTEHTIINGTDSKALSVYVPNKTIIQTGGSNDARSLNYNILKNQTSWRVPDDLDSGSSLLIGTVNDCDIVAGGIDLFTLVPTEKNGAGLIHCEFYKENNKWNNRTVFRTIQSKNTNGTSHVEFLNDISGTAMRARWADLAECYSADAPYPAGTLVKFGGEEEITIADDEVNAVVSENPAFLMDAENTENVKYKLPIALIGKVKLRILGKVKKFDRIVLSNTPGVGMVKPDKLHLDAIAIALESSEDEKEKMVLCSVKLKF